MATKTYTEIKPWGNVGFVPISNKALCIPYANIILQGRYGGELRHNAALESAHSWNPRHYMTCTMRGSNSAYYSSENSSRTAVITGSGTKTAGWEFQPSGIRAIVEGAVRGTVNVNAHSGDSSYSNSETGTNSERGIWFMWHFYNGGFFSLALVCDSCNGLNGYYFTTGADSLLVYRQWLYQRDDGGSHIPGCSFENSEEGGITNTLTDEFTAEVGFAKVTEYLEWQKSNNSILTNYTEAYYKEGPVWQVVVASVRPYLYLGRGGCYVGDANTEKAILVADIVTTRLQKQFNNYGSVRIQGTSTEYAYTKVELFDECEGLEDDYGLVDLKSEEAWSRMGWSITQKSGSYYTHVLAYSRTFGRARVHRPDGAFKVRYTIYGSNGQFSETKVADSARASDGIHASPVMEFDAERDYAGNVINGLTYTVRVDLVFYLNEEGQEVPLSDWCFQTKTRMNGTWRGFRQLNWRGLPSGENVRYFKRKRRTEIEYREVSGHPDTEDNVRWMAACGSSFHEYAMERVLEAVYGENNSAYKVLSLEYEVCGTPVVVNNQGRNLWTYVVNNNTDADGNDAITASPTLNEISNGPNVSVNPGVQLGFMGSINSHSTAYRDFEIKRERIEVPLTVREGLNLFPAEPIDLIASEPGTHVYLDIMGVSMTEEEGEE